jgi:hypothetical protein
MNCRRFQNRLFEYVEGSLSAGAQAAADRHLAACSACRQALHHEQQFAQFFSSRLRQDTETLTLRPEIRHGILTLPGREPTLPAIVESIVGLWNRFARLAAMAVSLLLVVTFLLVSHFSGARIHQAETSRFDDPNLQPVVSIQISCRLPTCQFRREGNLVIDTLSYQTIVASGTFEPGGREPVFAETRRQNATMKTRSSHSPQNLAAIYILHS